MKRSVKRQVQQMTLLLASAAMLAACGQKAEDTPPQQAGTTEVKTETIIDPDPAQPVDVSDTELTLPNTDSYDDHWFVSFGWPGEYPPGFSILEDGIVLQGRTKVDTSAPQNVSCPVEKYATYQEWNNERYKADDLKFVSVSEQFEFTLSQDVELDMPVEDDYEKVTLNAGEKVTYLRYIGEGFAWGSYQGREFDFDETTFYDASDMDTVAKNFGGEDLWVEIACNDAAKSRAWILFDEAVRTDGVAATPIMSYGESFDLDEDTAEEARIQMDMAAEFLDEDPVE